jgi:benzil reductase ((S)-benzoin forming)
MKDKLIIITGTTSGLGKEILEQIDLSSNKVISLNRRDVQYENIQNIIFDLSNIDSIDNLDIKFDINEIIFINNAFHESIGYIKNFSKNDIINIINTNILSVVLLVNKFLKILQKEQTLKIINISTGVVDSIIPSWSLYCCSKKFIENFMTTIDREHDNVICINFNPGIFNSTLQEKLRLSDDLKDNTNNYFNNIYQNKNFTDTKLVVKNLLSII